MDDLESMSFIAIKLMTNCMQMIGIGPCAILAGMKVLLELLIRQAGTLSCHLPAVGHHRFERLPCQ